MPTDERDVELSQRALDLAELGVGQVSPSPLVGCVIADTAGEVLGEGTYRFENVTHAEVLALEQAGNRSRGGTAYVSLEPHSYHGKTPPCTQALIDAAISRVVCPIEDPNPLVSGKGFARLRDAGIEVVTGILNAEASRQNEKFICWHRKGRPFFHLKLAMSLDGRISLRSSVSTSLSGDAARDRVHNLRHEYDAILVGGNTASVDDPNLTDRSGGARRRPLVRVLLDNRLQLTTASTIASTAKEIPTIIFTTSTDSEKIAELTATGMEVIVSEFGARDLTRVASELKSRDIQSVLVEGGAQVAGAFIDAGLVDKITFIYSPFVIGGAEAPNAVGGIGFASLGNALTLSDMTVAELDRDIEITGYPVRPQ